MEYIRVDCKNVINMSLEGHIDTGVGKLQVRAGCLSLKKYG